MKLRPKLPGGSGGSTWASLAASTATNVGHVRSSNEDFVQAATVVHDGRSYSVWAVADGVGGGPDGERASATAVETVLAYLCTESWLEPADGLTSAFKLANQRVFDITGQGRAATTLVVALVSEPDGEVTIANVGDSRAYLVAGGKSRQITQDHSLVAEKVAAGRMTADEARTAPDRNMLTRAVGSEAEVHTDMFGPWNLRPGERVVLCTDGVHGLIDDLTIGQLGGDLPMDSASGALVDAALRAGGHDNATALVGGFAPRAGQAACVNDDAGRLRPAVLSRLWRHIGQI